MAGLLVKLIVCPTVVYLSGLFIPQVHFTSVNQTMIVGLVLAVSAHIMELYLLKPNTIWISTGMDFIAATLIVYLVPMLMQGTQVTFLGALITGFVLALTEIPQHYWLTRTGKTAKNPEQAH